MSQSYTQQPAEGGKSRTGLIVAIIVGLIVLCCCLVIIVVFAVPALMGPAIGNVFSNIIQGLGTPTP
jgi:hypothetical protein